MVAAPLLLAAAPRAVAQRPDAIRIGADNDAFNFWIPPWSRTDQEYTSGIRGSLEYFGPSRLLAPLHRLGAYITCDRPGPCGSHSFGIGQAIFTGATEDYRLADLPPGQAPPPPRPNAAWLFVELSERDSSSRGAGELSVQLGVVGPPALGEQMQSLFHSLGPEYQRPMDWSRQLPFEPGFVVRYSRMTQLVSFADGERWRGSIVSHLGGAVGTIATDAVVGVGIRGDISLIRGRNDASSPRVALSLDARERLVLRDEFLDGTFFRPSDRMSKRPLVAEGSAAFTFVWRQLGLTYRVSRVGRQYDGQRVMSTWGTIETEWRLSR